MSKQKLSKILGLVILCLAVFVSLGVTHLFHACIHEDGHFGKCITAQRAIMMTATGIGIISLAGILIKNIKVRGILGIISILATVFMMLCPGVIFKLCMMKDMICNAAMRPATLILGLVMIIVEVIQVLVCMRKEDE